MPTPEDGTVVSPTRFERDIAPTLAARVKDHKHMMRPDPGPSRERFWIWLKCDGCYLMHMLDRTSLVPPEERVAFKRRILRSQVEDL